MKIKAFFKKFWNFYWKENSFLSYVFFLVFTYLALKFVLYPGFLFCTGLTDVLAIMTPSMEHNDNTQAYFIDYYSNLNYSVEDLPFNNGLNVGDVVFIKEYSNYSVGDVITFQSPYYSNKLVHRLVSVDPYVTKGDNNPESYIFDSVISKVYGKVVFRIPYLGLPRYLLYKITGL